MNDRLGVGVVGCGTISDVYLQNGRRLDALRFVACSDLQHENAERHARAFGLIASSTDDLIARNDVDVVLCLTPPDSHADVGLQAVAAGKHYYTEKPLATRVDDARRLLDAAAAAGVLVGSAPDTFLGAGIQTVRAAIEDGAIGTPVLAELRMHAGPPERWHPSPAFLYADLAGPLLDIGPYAVTAAVALFGRVRRVTAIAGRPRDKGVIEFGPRAGTAFPIQEPTRVAAVVEHESGVLTTITTTFDVDGAAPRGLEVHGSEGRLVGGDPNGFDGPVVLARGGGPDEELPLVSDWRDNARGLGLEDLCRAIRDGTPQRASGELGLHVVETLLAIRTSAREGTAVALDR